MSNNGLNELEITIFGVGFGDCIHVSSSDGFSFLIDTGLIKTYNRISNKLIQENKKVDYVILTHDHSDHIAGFTKFLTDDRFEIRGVLMWLASDTSIGITNSNRLQEIRNLLKTQDVTVFSIDTIANEYFPVRGEKIKILYPWNSLKYNAENKNKNSIILAFKISDYYVLLMGDATKTEEKVIFEKYKDEIDFDNTCFIKIGHHGSRTSSNKEFLNQIIGGYFKVAVCSCKESWESSPPDRDKIDEIEAILEENHGELICTGKNNINYDIKIKISIEDGRLRVDHEEEEVS